MIKLRLIALLLAFLAGFPSADANPRTSPVYGGTIPAPTLSIECRTGLNLSSILTVTRASTAWADDLSGVWHSFGNNVLAQTNKGCQSWDSRATGILHNRDFTNASWVKTNMTTALNATGIDNTSNSASTLTATAANATVMQSITTASATRIASVFIQRKTGTGEIDITQDGGTTWTHVTPCSSGTFIGYWNSPTTPNLPNCRGISTVQTITNPNVGIRIVTNGDAVIVDAFMDENVGAVSGSSVGPAIFTTTASVTRAADLVVAAAGVLPTISNNFAMSINVLRNTIGGQSFPSSVFLNFNSTSSNRLGWATTPTAPPARDQFNVVLVSGGSSGNQLSANVPPIGYPWVNAISLVPNAFSALYFDGTFNSRRGISALIPALTGIAVGSLNAASASNNCDCYVGKLNVWANQGALWNKTQLQQAIAMTQ